MEDSGKIEQNKDRKQKKSAFQRLRPKSDVNKKQRVDPSEERKLYDKQLYYNEAYHFFSNYIATVEILNDKKNIEKIYFQIPYCCRYISKNVKNSIIWESNRSSDMDRLLSFFSRIGSYEKEMIQRQNLRKFKFLFLNIINWHRWMYFNYFLILFLNCAMIASYNYDNDSEYNIPDDRSYNKFQSVPLEIAFTFAKYLQLLISLMVLVFSGIERYPIIQFRNVSDKHNTKIIEKTSNAKFRNHSGLRMLQYKSKVADSEPETKRNQYLKFIFDFYNIYRLIFFILSLVWWFIFDLMYWVLLFDIIVISKDLFSNLSSISRSVSTLSITIYFGVILIYSYSVIGFQFFAKSYTHDENDIYKMYCQTLLDWFISTLSNGIRANGGIGEALGSVDIQPRYDYWWRFVFDLSFYVIIMILLLNIIFGIIIDSFGSMREEINQKTKEVHDN